VKDYLKAASVIIVCATIVFIVLQMKSCGKKASVSASVSSPTDSNFSQISHEEYKPSSLPFSGKKAPVNLPEGVEEKDVQRVVSIEVKDVPKSEPKKIDVVETKSGEIYVAKDTSVVSVKVTEFEPKLFDFDLRFGVGLSVGLPSSGVRLSPAAVAAPIVWAGFIHAPIVVADLDGLGVGAQARLYHDIFVGAARFWRYDGGNQYKVLLSLIF
jgi:hypothetical protein